MRPCLYFQHNQSKYVYQEKFRAILEDDPIWVETVPRNVQEHILSKVDKNGYEPLFFPK